MEKQRELLLRQLATMSKEHQDATIDSMKRHIRIYAQKAQLPFVGRLALSLATLEVSIQDYDEALAKGERVDEELMAGEVQTLQKAVDARAALKEDGDVGV